MRCTRDSEQLCQENCPGEEVTQVGDSRTLSTATLICCDRGEMGGINLYCDKKAGTSPLERSEHMDDNYLTLMFIKVYTLIIWITYYISLK